MKTDIEIAQEAEMMPIKNVAEQLGITEDDIELYGKYKAKISNEYYEKIKDNEDGKLILVTAINPTPAGEGKTTVTVGLGEAWQASKSAERLGSCQSKNHGRNRARKVHAEHRTGRQIACNR